MRKNEKYSPLRGKKPEVSPRNVFKDGAEEKKQGPN
jgi:hypothetical protein